jgi:hypothetical protein
MLGNRRGHRRRGTAAPRRFIGCRGPFLPEEATILVSLIYGALRSVFELALLRCRSQEFKELEIVVLRHELAILRRQHGRPGLGPPIASSSRSSAPARGSGCLRALLHRARISVPRRRLSCRGDAGSTVA